MAGGKYLQQKPPKKVGGGKHNNNKNNNDNPFDIQDDMPEDDGKNKKGKAGKVIVIILIVLLLLIIIGAVIAIIFSNNVLNMMTRPDEMDTVPTKSEEELAALRGELPDELPTAPPEVTVTTSPEETWPEVVSDQNITNIMFIGNAARPEDTERFSDSNILVSINRETKTVTVTSIIRDLCVVIPAYAGHTRGYNRINHVYHLGSYYTGHKEDSMKLMALAIEQNFGVHVDYTIEVDMQIFEEVINLLGGVKVNISEEEYTYMRKNYMYMDNLEMGDVTISGYKALCYARMRKVGNGDWDRTERQREVILSLFNSVKQMNIMEIYGLFQQVMPVIITDMTNEQITNLAWEMIPMLKDLNIVSQRIPYDGGWWSKNFGSEEVPDWKIECNLSNTGKKLRESLGLEPAAE